MQGTKEILQTGIGKFDLQLFGFALMITVYNDFGTLVP